MRAQLIVVGVTGNVAIHFKKIDTPYLDSPFHFHQHCELVWVEESYGIRIVGDNVSSFEAGELVFMGPNVSHIYQNDAVFLKNSGLRARATVIYFPPDFLLNLSDEDSVIRPAQELIRRATRGLKFFGETHKQVTGILAGISEKDGLKKILKILSAIDILSQSNEYKYLASLSYKNDFEEKDSFRLGAAFAFLMKNYQRNISLAEVSAECNMTPTAFCRFFKSRTQKSVFQFLNELRIGNACKLLLNDKYTVADACYQSGYNNLANFNKFFKVVKGVTPTEYRKQLNLANAKSV